MLSSVTERLHRFGAWCGVGYLVTVGLGWGIIAGFLIPPHDPTYSATTIAAIFESDTTRIRIGMLFVMLAALFMVPFTAVITKVLARLEGGAGTLAYTALIGGVGNMVLTFYPATFWLVAAYRPERDPQLTYLLNDIAWLQLLGGVTMFLALPLSIGVAALVDDRSDPLLPRWLGYFNIWMCIAIVPDQLIFFFRSGPFAWNGVFGLWLPVVAFAGFFITTIWWLLRTSARVSVADVEPHREHGSVEAL